MWVHKPIQGTPVIAGHQLTKGLVGYWLFNEGMGDKVSDLSGNGNDGTLNGPLWVPGRDGPALDFDGDDDVITAPDSPVYSGLSAITVSFWVNFDDFGGGSDYNFIVAKSNWASQREWRFRTEVNAIVVWHISNDGASPGAGNSVQLNKNNFTVGAWHQLVGTYDAANNSLLEFYVDRVLKGTATGEAGGIFEGTAPLSFGSSGDNGGSGGQDDFHGQMSEVRIWDRALSAREIVEL